MQGCSSITDGLGQELGVNVHEIGNHDVRKYCKDEASAIGIKFVREIGDSIEFRGTKSQVRKFCNERELDPLLKRICNLVFPKKGNQKKRSTKQCFTLTDSDLRQIHAINNTLIARQGRRESVGWADDPD